MNNEKRVVVVGGAGKRGRLSLLTVTRTWERVRGSTLPCERFGSLEELAKETERRLASEPATTYAWLPRVDARGVFGRHAPLGPTHDARHPSIRTETVAQAMAHGAV